MMSSELGTEEDQVVEQPVLFEQVGAVGLLTLNRPQALNAMNVEMLESLLAFQGKVKGDRSIRVVVLRACGEKAFCVGADLKGRAKDYDSGSTEDQLGFLVRKVFRGFEQLETPVIAMVQGYALGGGAVGPGAGGSGGAAGGKARAGAPVEFGGVTLSGGWPAGGALWANALADSKTGRAPHRVLQPLRFFPCMTPTFRSS